MRGGHQHIRNAQARAMQANIHHTDHIAPYWGGFGHTCKRNGCSLKTTACERLVRAIFVAPAFCPSHGGSK